LQFVTQPMTYKIDLFAIFIFVGIVQAIFLSFFFFSKNNRKIETNVYQGIMVLAMAACTFEIFLCYTGYIIHCLWLVDFSEPLSFVIGPAFYLMIISLINGKTDSTRYYHFIVAVLWLLVQIPFFIQSDDMKFNAWIDAYHTAGLTFREVDADFFTMPYHSEIILAHLSIYMVMGFVATFNSFRFKNESVWKTKHPIFLQLRLTVLQIAFVIVLILTVKLFYRDDTGDHLFAVYISIAIYLISFQVIRQSGFFKQPNLVEQQKYKSSSLSQDDQSVILEKLKSLMQSEKPFLKSNFSLPELAVQLKVSTHQLSQVINDGLGKSFFEMTAEYRIEEAKRLLKDKVNIKVEEIAEEVGYNSKSSFNTAFKKITGKTPSEWRLG
jgi:AraC-like DNA-binding protein